MVDVVIRYGDGAWPDGRGVLLCEDDVFPVCSPAYAASRRLPETVGELLDHALLDYEAANPGWIGWKEWLAAFSTAKPGRAVMRLSYYTDVIHAALAGHGIALGWNRLVEDLLRQGRLRRVTDVHMRTRGAYFVVVPSRESVEAERGRLRRVARLAPQGRSRLRSAASGCGPRPPANARHDAAKGSKPEPRLPAVDHADFRVAVDDHDPRVARASGIDRLVQPGVTGAPGAVTSLLMAPAWRCTSRAVEAGITVPSASVGTPSRNGSSRTPRQAWRRERRWTGFALPNRSGRSSRAAQVRGTWTTPSTNRREAARLAGQRRGGGEPGGGACSSAPSRS